MYMYMYMYIYICICTCTCTITCTCTCTCACACACTELTLEREDRIMACNLWLQQLNMKARRINADENRISVSFINIGSHQCTNALQNCLTVQGIMRIEPAAPCAPDPAHPPPAPSAMPRSTPPR